MSKEDDFTCRPIDENDLAVEKSIALPVIIVLLLVSLPAIFYSTEMEAILKSIVNPLMKTLGSSFLWLVTIFVFMLIYFAVSKYGDIKFGDPDEKPEFPLGSWAAMIFTSGVAGACMFWAIVEPSWYLVTPPMNAQPESVEAYNLSLTFLLLNWGQRLGVLILFVHYQFVICSTSEDNPFCVSVQLLKLLSANAKTNS